MAVITATDLIEELTKLKQQNKDFRRQIQEIAKERQNLVSELGAANTVRQEFQDRADVIPALQDRIEKLETVSEGYRQQIDRLVHETQVASAEREAAFAARDQTLDKNTKLSAENRDLKKQAAEAEATAASLTDRVASLEPYRAAVAAFKQVL